MADDSRRQAEARESGEDDCETHVWKLRWFGHVERKEDGDWVKACQRLEVSGMRGKGRMTWRECVAEDMKVLGLEERDVQDRLK